MQALKAWISDHAINKRLFFLGGGRELRRFTHLPAGVDGVLVRLQEQSSRPHGTQPPCCNCPELYAQERSSRCPTSCRPPTALNAFSRLCFF